MQIWTEFSTKQCFRSARPARDAGTVRRIHAPRNAFVSFQVLVRDVVPFTVESVTVRRAGGRPLAAGARIRVFEQKYDEYNDCISYPDRLIEISGEDMCLEVPASASQGFWIDFRIPAGTRPGMRRYVISVGDQNGNAAECSVDLILHSAVLPDPSESLFDHEYFFNTVLTPDEDREASVKFSKVWWKLLEHYADVFKELRNNYIWLQLTELLCAAGSRKNEDGTYDFRWDIFDRYVQLFIDHGAKGFTLQAQVESVNGKYITAIGPGGDPVRIDTSAGECEEYVRALYGAVWQHLGEKGWRSRFRAHIEDEPHTTGVWLRIRELLAEVCPGLVAGEPIDMIESAGEISEVAEWMVPRVNVFEKDRELFGRFVDRGGLLWLYSCCYPEEPWWLNKFVDLPPIRSRLMEWACVDVGAKGFLHWGFNFWGDGNSLYGFNPDARFKGDGAIVYSNRLTGGLDPSSRFMNTRDGLQDAELFMQIFANGDAAAVQEAKTLARNDRRKLYFAVGRLRRIRRRICKIA